MDIKISEFPSVSTIAPNDLFTIVRSGNNYIIPCSAIDIIDRAIISNKTVILSGDDIRLGSTSKIIIDDSFVRILHPDGVSTFFDTEEVVLYDNSSLPSVSVGNRNLHNQYGNPCIIFQENPKCTYYGISGDNIEGVINTVPVVTRSTPTAGQVLSGVSFSDETHYVTPTTSLSALTWTLPLASKSRVGQIKTFLSTQNITTLTVNAGSGGTKVGNSLTTAYANEAYSFQCVSVSANGTWLRLA